MNLGFCLGKNYLHHSHSQEIPRGKTYNVMNIFMGLLELIQNVTQGFKPECILFLSVKDSCLYVHLSNIK